MAEQSANQENVTQSFAEFVKASPSAAERGLGMVNLTGVVLRSDKANMFMLVLTSGEALELNVEDVQQYSVVQQVGTDQLVQVTLPANKVAPNQPGVTKGNNTDPLVDVGTVKEGPLDTIKEVNTDTFVDNFKHSNTDPLIDTFKESTTDPLIDTFKEPTTDPLFDTSPIQDQLKAPGLDTNPLIDQVKAPAFDTIQEGIGTIQEGTLPGLPPGGGINPGQRGLAGMGGNMAPFVMATPHHAPQAAVMMQQALGGRGLQGGAGQIGNPITLKEVIQDPIITIKEMVKDPIQDPITWVETIFPGTLVENINPGLPGGGIINPPVWNLPGLMF